jgi:phosphatidylglycerophosphate synthase
MHKSNKVADWHDIKGEKRNIWQKLAFRSYGTLTPANFVSLGGGVLALYGLFLILNTEIISGLLLLTLGRIADLLDGLIAEYTKTKSPLGELVDAVSDKLVIASAVIVFAAIELVPWPIVLLIAFQNVFNGLAVIIGRLRKIRIHPSKYGKYSTALAWVTLIFYPFGDWIKENENSLTGIILIIIALISFAFWIVIGLMASIRYAAAIKGKK